jgi:hypothetical protein
MPRAKKFSKADAVRRLNAEHTAMLKEIGLSRPDSDELNRLLKSKDFRSTVSVANGVKITLGMLIKNPGEALRSAGNIENEEQLQDFIRYSGAHREKIPTELRKALKEVQASLPRRGGPGRQRKLKPGEDAQMCDQISTFIRQGHNLKLALQKVSLLTPQLLGKKVSSRTLQKAWNRRGQ